MRTTFSSANVPEAKPASMLTAHFHLRFFPALIKGRFGRRPSDQPTRFLGADFHRCVLVLLLGIVSAWIGFSLYPGAAGLLLLAVAMASVIYATVISILGARGVEPTYECFLFPAFFFCLSLGLTAGAVAGLGSPTYVRLMWVCAGLAVGYWAGLLAGFYGQRLGLIAVMLYPFWLAGAVGALIPAILLLST